MSKIYQIAPPFETVTANGRPARVTDYEPGCGRPWLGTVLFAGRWEFQRWNKNGDVWGEGGLTLTSLPPIPPEAREPQVGEVWATVDGGAALILDARDNGKVVGLMASSRSQSQAADLLYPWPSDRPTALRS